MVSCRLLQHYLVSLFFSLFSDGVARSVWNATLDCWLRAGRTQRGRGRVTAALALGRATPSGR